MEQSGGKKDLGISLHQRSLCELFHPSPPPQHIININNNCLKWCVRAQRYLVLQLKCSVDRLTHTHTYTQQLHVECLMGWSRHWLNLLPRTSTLPWTLWPFTINTVVLTETIVRRFHSIANNTLTWLLPLAREENQYNIWVQMANSHHRKCKLQGTGSSAPMLKWALNSQLTIMVPSQAPSLSLSVSLFHFFPCLSADCSNCRVSTVGQVKRVCLFLFLLNAPERCLCASSCSLQQLTSEKVPL